MANSMLEYTKQILEKVSFDPVLFNKEFLKAKDYLMDHEVQELIIWCKKHFSEILASF